MELSVTQRMAMACARRPWRTVGVWVAVVIAALAAIALLLGSALTPEGRITSEPDSIKGLNLVDDQFPDRDAVSELVVVVADSGDVERPAGPDGRGRPARGDRDRRGGPRRRDPYAADAVGLSSAQQGTPSRSRSSWTTSTRPTAGTDPLVGIAVVIDAVEAADRQEEVSADITGTLDRQQRLHRGLAARPREGRDAVRPAGRADRAAAGLRCRGRCLRAPDDRRSSRSSSRSASPSLVGQAFELSFFIVNMAVAMGLALGIDYSLFVVSRYREERYAGLAEARRDRGLGRHRQQGRAVLRARPSWWRCSACCSCQTRCCAAWRPGPCSWGS